MTKYLYLEIQVREVFYRHSGSRMASCLLFFAVFSLLAAAARSQSGDSKESSAEAVVVGSVVGGVCVLLFAGISAFYLYRRSGGVQSPHPRHSGSEEAVKITLTGVSSEPTDLHIVKAGNMEISIQVRRSATNNFSKHNIVGKGGFGTVCKGELHDGTKIAVKRIESGVMSDNGLDELHSEIADLTKVRHRHLVALLGYCLDGNEWLLVHEYMPQRTLSMFLFNWNEEGLSPLEWIKRLTIALDAARAVEYLHGLAQQSFVHGDLKPSNILLLGDDMRAKVADYELFRLGKASIATKPAGYLAPEYAASGRVSSKIDVFSFGVILMEMITGRKAMNESFPDEREHLVPWFRRMRISKDNFHKAIDPTLEINEVTLSNINTVSELAGLCTAREPHQRPDMGHVVNLLSSLVELWKPSEPAHPNDEMTLAQVHKKWQALEGISYRNTNTSIPSRSPGFAFSLTSMDGR